MTRGEEAGEAVGGVQSAEKALIDPWPLWSTEDWDEDDDGDLIENTGKRVLWLTAVIFPDGSEWISSMMAPRLMLRRDVVDLESSPPDTWGFERRPESLNNLAGTPTAEPTAANFDPELIEALHSIPGAKVLPLANDGKRQAAAHAIFRSEDWIGYVMAAVGRRPGAPLPESLRVPEPRIRPGQPTSPGSQATS